MSKKSAGLLAYRRRAGRVEVFLVHPGGPYWARKDDGAWSLPKGEFTTEDPLEAAKREFLEETGFETLGPFKALAPIRQPGGKLIHAWAFEGDYDPSLIESNTFFMEWPPGSGMEREFPEVDRAGWFSIEKAREKITRGQAGFIDELEKLTGPDETK
ncbi:MAG TPA: NUDIX domain-containing protein [Syntrophales bacterium]|jgi:predicted NUDIX family NTP pyrophosphohydrolase|nr:NUDIX domain-containing protein [Syntrophales bacterium]HRT60779.1 NUDIX domain-containing protein [Syntrophales bacterium]